MYCTVVHIQAGPWSDEPTQQIQRPWWRWWSPLWWSRRELSWWWQRGANSLSKKLSSSHPHADIHYYIVERDCAQLLPYCLPDSNCLPRLFSPIQHPCTGCTTATETVPTYSSIGLHGAKATFSTSFTVMLKLPWIVTIPPTYANILLLSLIWNLLATDLNGLEALIALEYHSLFRWRPLFNRMIDSGWLFTMGVTSDHRSVQPFRSKMTTKIKASLVKRSRREGKKRSNDDDDAKRCHFITDCLSKCLGSSLYEKANTLFNSIVGKG